MRTSSYHIVIFPHLIKQFSKIKLKFKYPPSFSTLSIAKFVCVKKHWFADIENFGILEQVGCIEYQFIGFSDLMKYVKCK